MCIPSFLPGYPSKYLVPFLSPSLGLLSYPLLQEQPGSGGKGSAGGGLFNLLALPRCLPSPLLYPQSSCQWYLDHQSCQGSETCIPSSPRAYRSRHPSPASCWPALKAQVQATLQYTLQVTIFNGK